MCHLTLTSPLCVREMSMKICALEIVAQCTYKACCMKKMALYEKYPFERHCDLCPLRIINHRTTEYPRMKIKTPPSAGSCSPNRSYIILLSKHHLTYEYYVSNGIYCKDAI